MRHHQGINCQGGGGCQSTCLTRNRHGRQGGRITSEGQGGICHTIDDIQRCETREVSLQVAQRQLRITRHGQCHACNSLLHDSSIGNRFIRFRILPCQTCEGLFTRDFSLQVTHRNGCVKNTIFHKRRTTCREIAYRRCITTDGSQLHTHLFRCRNQCIVVICQGQGCAINRGITHRQGICRQGNITCRQGCCTIKGICRERQACCRTFSQRNAILQLNAFAQDHSAFHRHVAIEDHRATIGLNCHVVQGRCGILLGPTIRSVPTITDIQRTCSDHNRAVVEGRIRKEDRFRIIQGQGATIQVDCIPCPIRCQRANIRRTANRGVCCQGNVIGLPSALIIQRGARIRQGTTCKRDGHRLCITLHIQGRTRLNNHTTICELTRSPHGHRTRGNRHIRRSRQGATQRAITDQRVSYGFRQGRYATAHREIHTNRSRGRRQGLNY